MKSDCFPSHSPEGDGKQLFSLRDFNRSAASILILEISVHIFQFDKLLNDFAISYLYNSLPLSHIECYTVYGSMLKNSNLPKKIREEKAVCIT
jgi:hypothetical protein